MPTLSELCNYFICTHFLIKLEKPRGQVSKRRNLEKRGRGKTSQIQRFPLEFRMFKRKTGEEKAHGSEIVIRAPGRTEKE